MPIITPNEIKEITNRIFYEFDEIETGMECCLAVDIPNNIDAARIKPHFNRIDLIRIPFPSSADGRGFSIARRLRAYGFTGIIRATGHVLSDQYAAAFRCGFDEITPDDSLYTRQTDDNWKSNTLSSYRNKLRNPQKIAS